MFSEFSHLAWINTPRKQGGLGEMNIPILADKTKKVARDYGVLLEDAGVTLRGMYWEKGKEQVFCDHVLINFGHFYTRSLYYFPKW